MATTFEQLLVDTTKYIVEPTIPTRNDEPVLYALDHQTVKGVIISSVLKLEKEFMATNSLNWQCQTM